MAKKKKSNTTAKIVAVMVALFMIGSIAGVLNYDNVRNLEYEGHKFKASEFGYTTVVDRVEYSFTFHPSEVENIGFPQDTAQRFRASEALLITAEQNSSLTRPISLLKLDLERASQYTGKPIGHGFTEETAAMPLIDCEAATSVAPVLYFIKGDDRNVTITDDCFMIQARTDAEIVMFRDAVLYMILGIID